MPDTVPVEQLADRDRSGIRRPVIDPQKQYRGGGKAGRVCIKASSALRDYRWVAKHPTEEPVTPERAALQQVLAEQPEVFRARLDELERAHEAAVEKAIAAKAIAKSTSSLGASDDHRTVSRKVGDAPEAPVEAGPEPVQQVHARPSSVSDPQMLSSTKKRLMKLKVSYPETIRQGLCLSVDVNLIAGLWWLAEEVRRLNGDRENEMLAEVDSWGGETQGTFLVDA